MNLDLKNNKYLLSLISSILGTVVYVIVEYITSKEENKKVDYLHILKIMAIIFCCVISSLSVIGSTETVVSNTENILPSNDLNLGPSLQEINMNQSIHTGNPQF